MIEELFFELVRVAIGTQASLSRIPTEVEWNEMFDMAVKQSLVGVCFVGLHNLGADSDDGFSKIGMSEDLYFDWMGIATQIQMKNEVVNEQCVALQQRLSADGYRSCIFKGQAVASLYSTDTSSELSLFRQSGDIDIWIEGGKRRVIALVQRISPTKEIREAHAQLKVFDDTEVEAHYRPGLIRNFVKNARLQKFFIEQAEACFNNKIYLSYPNLTICAPTTEFNLVHQLTHIFHHLFTEGVGLRQVMDYYFVLRNASEVSSSTGSKNWSQTKDQEVKKVVLDLGLERFASALMWVIGYVFGLPKDKMPWRPVEKDGRFLLNEIMRSGNFGKGDNRYDFHNMNSLQSFVRITHKNISYIRFAPFDWFWSPLWRVYHFIVRKVNGYE